MNRKLYIYVSFYISNSIPIEYGRIKFMPKLLSIRTLNNLNIAKIWIHTTLDQRDPGKTI